MKRGLAWLVDDAASSLESRRTAGDARTWRSTSRSSASCSARRWSRSFTGHVLMLEDVGEYMYRIDRYFFHVTSNAECSALCGHPAWAMLGRAEE